MHKIALLLAVLVFAFATADEPPKFHFPEFLVGAWEVESAIITSDRHEVRNFVANITTGAHDSVLRGLVDYTDGDEESEIIVDLESSKFTIQEKKGGSDEDDIDADLSDVTPIVQEEFSFNFVTQTLYVSQGRFTADNNTRAGTYEFLVTSPTTFVLSFVYDGGKGDDFEVKRLVAKKKLVAAEASFFSKYGTTIMIAVFFIGSRLIQSRTKAAAAGAAPARQ